MTSGGTSINKATVNKGVNKELGESKLEGRGWRTFVGQTDAPVHVGDLSWGS